MADIHETFGTGWDNVHFLYKEEWMKKIFKRDPETGYFIPELLIDDVKKNYNAIWSMFIEELDGVSSMWGRPCEPRDLEEIILEMKRKNENEDLGELEYYKEKSHEWHTQLVDALTEKNKLLDEKRELENKIHELTRDIKISEGKRRIMRGVMTSIKIRHKNLVVFLTHKAHGYISRRNMRGFINFVERNTIQEINNMTEEELVEYTADNF